MDDDALISDIRAFNRFYTRLIGALESGHLQTPYTLTEARAIYEIATRGSVTHGDLARALRLDPGYITRLNQRLTDLGLISATPDPKDRRATQVALTPQGEAAFDELDRLTDDLVRDVLAPLDDGRKRMLGESLGAVRRLLDDDRPRGAVILRPHRIGDLGWMISRQGLLYNRQFGWNIEFEALIAGIYRDFESAPHDPPRNLWVAEQDGAVVGSVFCMPSDGIAGSAQLRMLYVEPAARGQGIGAVLVDQCVRFARDSGYERMRLWTHTIQESARRVYSAAGFGVVETMPEHNFGKDLVGEIWEMRF